MDKTAELPYDLKIIELKTDNNSFLPASKLNELRKQIIKILEKNNLINNEIDDLKFEEILIKEKNQKINSNKSTFIYSFNEEKIEEYNKLSCDYIYINI